MSTFNYTLLTAKFLQIRLDKKINIKALATTQHGINEIYLINSFCTVLGNGRLVKSMCLL